MSQYDEDQVRDGSEGQGKGRRGHAPAWGSVRKLGHHSAVYTCLALGGPGFNSAIRKGLQAKECEKLLQAGDSDPHTSKGRADLRTPGPLGFPT